MLDPRLQEWMSRGYMKIGDISYDIALAMKKGKNHTPSQRNRYEQGIKIYSILDVLFRHVTFTNDVPILWRIEEETVNKFVRCLVEIGELDKLPAAPSLFPTSKPTVIQTGATGTSVVGPPGSDANINVILKTGEIQLKLIESVISEVKTFEISLVDYVLPNLMIEIQGGKIFEVGDERDFDITITSLKGTEDITTIICDDSTVNATLQSLLDIVAANDIGSQPYQIMIPVTTQQIDQVFTISTNDGQNIVDATDAINFYFPFLFGATTSNTPTHYTSLTKLIEAKGNKEFIFNDTDKYFWVCYPSSYGTLTKLKDENGLNVIDDFTTSLVNITSSGLDNNYTEEFRLYRTTIKTSINQTYSIQF